MEAEENTGHSPTRAPLNRDLVVRRALGLADANGIAALTMRSLALDLGVKPMSLYYHVANKGEILDAIIDLVFAEIEVPSMGRGWQGQMRRRAFSVREVLGRHPWAIGLLESRTAPGPATLRHHDSTLGVLRSAGFPVPLAAHAYALMDSYIYGFAVQESSLPIGSADSGVDAIEPLVHRLSAGQYPYLLEMASEYIMQPGYDFGNEFEIGLELVLRGLQARLAGGDST